MTKPIIGVTMGDPAGVGPEIIAKSLAHKEIYDICTPVIIGDHARMCQAARICQLGTDFKVISSPAQTAMNPAEGYIIDLGGVPPDLPFGALSKLGGEAAYRYIRKAAELALDRSIDAISTAPLNKAALHAAGHIYPGHTEMLAELTGVPEVSMLLSSGALKVVHVTTHIGLIDAIRQIDAGLVRRTIERGYRILVDSGVTAPRIAVCGINPHAGENGLFGYGEEEQKIVPAIEASVASGIQAVGPLPADTAFYRAGRGDFDLIVAMYHDQGHSPIKVLGLDTGVNITIGLPVVRTSVDHGTAFDIAGTGTADESSLLAALREAAALAPQRGEVQAELGRR